MIMNNNEEIIKEESDSYNNELTSNSGKIIENEVSKSDTVKINSDDENIEIVRESERVMGVGGCEGVEISVDELEREYEESYFVDIGQRVNFPCVYCEPRGLRVLLKGESPLVENDVFSNCSLSFCGVRGKSRRCFYVVVPSAWYDREKVKWCYDERYCCLLYTSRCV